MLSTAADFYTALRIEGASSKQTKRLFLFLSIAVNLSILAFFKYTGFALSIIQDAISPFVGSMEVPSFFHHIVLPVGISFYTFQTMLTEKYEQFDLIPKSCNRIVLGDSRSHQGLISGILDMNSKFYTWNLACPGMQAPFYFLITKRFLESGHKLDMIVMNISFYMLGGWRWMNNIYFTYYKSNISDWLISLATLNPSAIVWWLKSKIPSWRHYKKLKPMTRYDKNTLNQFAVEAKKFYQQNNTIRARGYLSRGDSSLTSQLQEMNFKTSGWWNGIPYLTNSINRALFLLARFKNIKVYVYEFPFPTYYQNSGYFKKIFSHYRRLLDAIIEDYYPFVERLPNADYCEPEYLVDELHANEKGSRRLSRELNELINARENNPSLQKERGGCNIGLQIFRLVSYKDKNAAHLLI